MKLAEECQSKLWKDIYEMRGRGLPFNAIGLVLDTIEDGVRKLADLEADIDKGQATGDIESWFDTPDCSN